MIDLYLFETEARALGYQNIVGVDEVGRGPMAGPVVVSAVMLPQDVFISGLNDSKKLSKKQREKLYEEIMKIAIEVQTVFIEVEEVDRINVYQASKKAMEQAIRQFKTPVDYVLSDAMKLDITLPYQSIIKGDSKSASIASASIIAKVSRDAYMEEMDEKYPEYGFKSHMGYVTKRHKEALSKFGVTPIHRKSFAPVQEVLQNKQVK